MNYDVFISYRRKGGYETAKHIYDLLRMEGYSVSFDLDTLRNGDFDTQLLKRIDECKDFILILNKGAFDRSVDPSFERSKDWMRLELAEALAKNKNIIPVMLPGFDDYPENLPADISEVARKNGPKHSMEYFDEFYRKLKNNFMQSHPTINLNYGSQSEQEKPSGESVLILRIYPSKDCRIEKYGEVLGSVKAGKYLPIKLKKGKHRLDFIPLEDEKNIVTKEYVVEDTDMEDVLDIEFKVEVTHQQPKETSGPESSKPKTNKEIWDEWKKENLKTPSLKPKSNKEIWDDWKKENLSSYQEAAKSPTGIMIKDIKFEALDKGNLKITIDWIGKNKPYQIKIYQKKYGKKKFTKRKQDMIIGDGSFQTLDYALQSFEYDASHDANVVNEIRVEILDGNRVVAEKESLFTIYHYFKFFSKSIYRLV